MAMAALGAGTAAPFLDLAGMSNPAESTSLVTSRAFRLVRNPIFSAMLVTAAGLAAMVPNIAALAGLVALVVALELQVLPRLGRLPERSPL